MNQRIAMNVSRTNTEVIVNSPSLSGECNLIVMEVIVVLGWPISNVPNYMYLDYLKQNNNNEDGNNEVYDNIGYCC